MQKNLPFEFTVKTSMSVSDLTTKMVTGVLPENPSPELRLLRLLYKMPRSVIKQIDFTEINNGINVSVYFTN